MAYATLVFFIKETMKKSKTKVYESWPFMMIRFISHLVLSSLKDLRKMQKLDVEIEL